MAQTCFGCGEAMGTVHRSNCPMLTPPEREATAVPGSPPPEEWMTEDELKALEVWSVTPVVPPPGATLRLVVGDRVCDAHSVPDLIRRLVAECRQAAAIRARGRC